MTNKIYCAGLVGTDTRIIEIESAFTRGLPNFHITGLATSSIQESKQRVQSALANSNFTLPPLKITINLSPSDIPKSGSYFDLPIALVLQANAQPALPQEAQDSKKWFAFGELGLDGSIKYTQSMYPLLFDLALLAPSSHVIVPESAKDMLEVIPHLHFHFAPTLACALDILTTPLPSASQDSFLDSQTFKENQNAKEKHCMQKLGFSCLEVEGELYYYLHDFELDFSEVRNQEVAKRAALIAAAGFHNIIFEGSPGCGKSMIAKRMRAILPPMSLKEMMQTLKLQCLDSHNPTYSPLRPFRNPHQSASKASILGSATQYEPKPGEIALAHNGILFFDELPHFKRDILESLREPLENNKMTISRVHSKLEYDTSFQFIGAQNPCPCGNLLSPTKECRCQDKEIATYKNRLSEPFLDRIDLFVQMNEKEREEGDKAVSGLDSQSMQKSVFEAFIFARQTRGQKVFNAKLSEKEIEEFCTLSAEAQTLLSQASERFNLSMRSLNKIKKIARTIADLAQSPQIHKEHILEALSFRRI
ncbi:Fis family transcriptional regulator [Helicobacter sp. MIT 00-7814]|uniref:YifB family Mg chelatase-like AAA ATPase n=1 Tax=unclassified Helicobacter TaxID=2593540 RepID=UPI000E1F8213|nr:MULTISPECIES: YifB family Mg chelatase-like AAA ATPase [unclassified Helicobacter]RDU52017.1 Fis family transcriptional regulator [Helicobacter sp. MIT 00-7814]RDU52021.1 Fis family transcriptional regulator [Helicobacter sp. MIT 99-10781]